jgi:uncharacterized membrane protein
MGQASLTLSYGLPEVWVQPHTFWMLGKLCRVRPNLYTSPQVVILLIQSSADILFVRPVIGVKEESMVLIQKIIHALLVVQPPHPLFTHFPVALISTALFFLLLALWRKSDLLEKIAFANLCVAAVSIVVAAFFGIRDNLVIFKGTAPNHLAKLIIATILFLVTGATALLRWKNPDLFHGRYKGLYLAIHFFLFALVAVQGFLGGIIVYGF